MSEVDSRVRWFGESWQAPICEPDNHAETPVGAPCARCRSRIKRFERGLLIFAPDHVIEGLPPNRVAYHIDCFLTEIGGRGINE